MLAISVLALGAVAIVLSGLPAIAPVLQRHYGLTLVQTGSLFGAISVGAVLTVTLWGIAADRYGERWVLGLGMGAGAVAVAALGLVSGYPALLGVLAVVGALTATAAVGSGRALMAWFGPRERGLALGLRQMAIPLGGALAAVLLPFMVVRTSLPVVYLFLAVVCAGPAIGALVVLRVEQPAGPAVGRAPSWHAPLRDRRLWRLAIASTLVVIGQTSMVAYLVLYLTGVRHLPLQAAALALLAAQLCGAAARVGLGALSDRMGSRIRPLRWVAATSCLLFTVSAIALDGPLALVLPLVTAATVASMGSNGLGYTAAAEIGGRHGAGGALGFQNTAMYLAGAWSPVAFGAVVSLVDWRSGFVILSAAAAAGWVVSRGLRAEEARGWTRLGAPAAEDAARIGAV